MKVAVTLFFFAKRQEDEGLARNHHVRTEGTDPGGLHWRVADVREKTKVEVRCFFNDLWRLNQDRGRGAPSKEYLKRVRARELLVTSYVVSYDFSSNPTVVEDESIPSVKKNRRALVE